MNVEEYFPEGLSVIHPDESHREKRGIKEDLKTAFSPPIHCHICYKNIPASVNNVDFIKPCNCQIMYVHTRCATRNKIKFGKAKCSNCGQGSTVSRSAKMFQTKKVGLLSAGTSEDGNACFACHCENYNENKEDRKNNLGQMIRPCFCGRMLHFGCFSSLLEEKAACTECGVLYHSFEPASLQLFLRRNWKYYAAYVVVLAFFSTLFTIALKNSILTRQKDYDTKSIILTVTAVFFFIVIATILTFGLKYTFFNVIPRFRISHGKAILKPYKSSSATKLPSKRMLEPVLEDEFEDIPLSDLGNPPTEPSQTEEVHAIEDARGYETEDMTLGQHMFGIYATHHSSSTPIEKPGLGFVFNSA